MNTQNNLARSLDNYINYYSPELGKDIPTFLNNQEPLNAVIITSIRDVGACDQNGRWVNTREGTTYMNGLIESITRDYRSKLYNIIRIVGIITDDTKRDETRNKLNGYSREPNSNMDWIHPLDLRNSRGELLINFTENIPSNFRSLPMRQIDERIQKKENFENRVLQTMRQMGGDILISDHLMMQAELLVQKLRGKILNIHPAITNINNPHYLRGPTPTQDAIDRANGFIRDHRTGQKRIIEKYGWTGATLHLMNEKIDDGPLICDAETTLVNPYDTAQELRIRNYRDAKIPVFVNGIIHYKNNICRSTY